MGPDRLGTASAMGRARVGLAPEALGFVALGRLRPALNDRLRTGTDWGNLTV
jgi:hypothetical protein